MSKHSAPENRNPTAPGRKRKTLAVEVRYGDVPWEVGWPRVEDALVRLMLPKLQEILERERANPQFGVQQEAPVEGGIA